VKIVTAEQMRAIDRRASRAPGIPEATLMENAGAALAEQALAMLGGRSGPVVVACGPGNNGGDGFAAARHLLARGVEVLCLLAAPRTSFRGAARRHLAVAMKAGVPFADAAAPARLRRAAPALSGAALVVDAILGTGVSRDVEGHLAEVVSAVNGSPAPVLSADVPSGLDATTGLPRGETVVADVTVTFGWPKLGLFLSPGAAFAGEVVVADIGFPEGAAEGVDIRGSLLAGEAVERAFPPRLRDSHKGDFGHLLVVAGSAGKVGAGVLSCQGALRSGAGLVTYALPASAVHAPLAAIPEIMTFPLPETGSGAISHASRVAVERMAARCDALVVGPGLGTEEETSRLVKDLLSSAEAPAVVDADGLNALGSDLAFLRPRGERTVLTPHPGEMARLLGTGAGAVQADRVASATACAAASGCTVVLKGAATLVARADGTWFLNPTGNPGMATAGTGDVLAGMIGALLARGVEPAEAACAAVFLHGRAGDLAAEELGEEAMTAGDLLGHIGPALCGLREGRSRP